MSIYLDAALRCAARGWHVFPTRITKAPYTTHGVKDATTDVETIRAWWTKWPTAGIGLACGAVSGVWALDVDVDKGGGLSLDDLCMTHGLMPDTLMSLTGGGGRHYFFRAPPGLRIRNSVSTIGAGLDCRGDGGYVVLPPSLHDSGGTYRWPVDDDLPIEDAPQWLLDSVTIRAAGPVAPGASTSGQALPVGVRNPKAYVEAALASAVSKIQNAPAGTANNTLNTEAFGFQRFINAGWVSRAKVEESLFLAAEARGKAAGEIRKTLASALGTAREPAEAAGPTMVIERSGETATPPADGAVIVPSSAPMRLAEWFLRTRRDAQGRLMLRRWRNGWWQYAEGHYTELGLERLEGDLWAWMDRVFVPDKNHDPKRLDPKASTVANVLKALLGLGTLVPDDIDPPAHLGRAEVFRDLDTAVVSNGMLDLQSGTVSALSPDLFATCALGSAWPTDGAPPAPAAWLQFLDDAWGDDAESIRLLQEWFGYCLTPDTSQQKMLWILGPPRSGKGTIVTILRALLGHRHVVDPKLTDLSGAFGLQPWLNKTLAVIPDARLSGRADSDTIVETLLSVSGEDFMTVQRKQIESVTCRLSTRIMLLSNLAPRLSDSSGALASRLLLLKMRRSNLGREDPDLRTKLLAELPGILGWAVEGWRSLRTRGRFVQPASADGALAEFASYGSPIATFVDECCMVREGLEVSKQALFDRWKRWCADNGNESGSLANMSRNLTGAVPGIQSHKRDRYRGAYFTGIGLDDGL